MISGVDQNQAVEIDKNQNTQKAETALKYSTVLAYGMANDTKELKKRLVNITRRTKVPAWVGLSCTLLLLIIAITFTMIGCSNRGNTAGTDIDGNQNIENSNGATPVYIPDEVFHIIEPDRASFYGEVLRIATFDSLTITPLARAYERENPGVTIEVIDIWYQYRSNGENFSETIETARKQIAEDFITGSAPTLIDTTFLDIHDPRTTEYLVDWLPVITADPDFIENDWFMNVFHALAVNGNLYQFPMGFLYNVVAINNTIPGLREMLSGRSSITIPELVELTLRFSASEHFYPYFGFTTSIAAYLSLDSFIDLNNGIVDFNNDRFIDLLLDSREVTAPDADINVWTGTGSIVSRSNEQQWSDRYLFVLASPHTLQYYFDFTEGPIFVDRIPLVNEQNELLISPWPNYAMNLHTTFTEQALAWDFLKFVMAPDNFKSHLTFLPTNRELFHALAVPLLQDFSNNHFFTFDGWETADPTEVVLSNTIIYMEELGNLPMKWIDDYPHEISTLIFNTIKPFHLGRVSAEQTAAELQFAVEEILKELDLLS